MIHIFCNLVELIRLRESLIVALSESTVLADIYDTLKDMVNRSNFKLLAQSSIPFQPTDGFSRDNLNFFEDGALTG